MRYLAILHAEAGCDDSIGCGIRLMEHTASSLAEAHDRMLANLQREFREQPREAPRYRLVTIYEISASMEAHRVSLQQLRDQWTAQLAEEAKQATETAERREYERLKQKFGA